MVATEPDRPRPRLGLAALLAPLALLVAATVCIRVWDLDLRVARSFHSGEAGWIGRRGFWELLSEIAGIPALCLTFTALGLLIGAAFVERWRKFRRASLFVILLLAAGPGLVVNTGFKDNWGRPRPRNVAEFGGKSEFLPVWELGERGGGRSFPSGHASLGFYLMAPFFLLFGRSRREAWLVLAVGLAWGAFVGFGRMTQGGHFLSDVLWAAGMVYLVGLGLYRALGIDAPAAQPGRA